MKTEKNNALIALSNLRNLVEGSKQLNVATSASAPPFYLKPTSRVDSSEGPKAIPYYGGEVIKGPSYNGQVKRGARWVAAEEVLPDAIPYFREGRTKPNFSSLDEAEAGLAPSIKSTTRANKVNQNWQNNLGKVIKNNLHHLTNLSNMGNPGVFAVAPNDPSLMGDQKILTDGFTVPISENYTNYLDPEHGWQVLDTISDANGVLWYTDVNGDRKVLDAGLPDTYSFKEFPDVGYRRPDYTKPVRDLNPLDIADFNNSYLVQNMGLPKLYDGDGKNIVHDIANPQPTVNSVAKSIASKQKPVLKAAPKSTSKVDTTVNSAPVVAAPAETTTVQPTAQVTAPSLDSIMQHKKQAYANYQNQVRQSAIDAFNRSGYGNPLDALRNGAISQGQFKIIANGY